MRSRIQEQLKAGLYVYYLILFPLHTSHLNIRIHSPICLLVDIQQKLYFLSPELSPLSSSLDVIIPPCAEKSSLQQAGWQVHSDSDKSKQNSRIGLYKGQFRYAQEWGGYIHCGTEVLSQQRLMALSVVLRLPTCNNEVISFLATMRSYTLQKVIPINFSGCMTYSSSGYENWATSFDGIFFFPQRLIFLVYVIFLTLLST